jgi:hypothetical protein
MCSNHEAYKLVVARGLPWERTRSRSRAGSEAGSAGFTPRKGKGEGKGKKGKDGKGGKGKGKLPQMQWSNKSAVNFSLFCRQGTDCAGKEAPGGDGTCKKAHLPKDMADYVIQVHKAQEGAVA